ncbi:MAG: alanine--glyoxylate aminotransferase family protein [Pseudomonadota bacterium]
MTQIPQRHLFGPGPTNVPGPILDALAMPTIGHLDPEFLTLMDEVSARLRYCYQTSNPLTFVMSAPGTIGMEASLTNLLEPGDKAIICINGVFGGRMRDIAQRAGADVVAVENDWGTPVDPEAVDAALRAHPDAVLLAFVHAETSTGVRSDAKRLAALGREYDCLVVADCVTSLSGVPLGVDDWQIDVAYSGSQKCLACVPGLSPVTYSPRAVERVKARRTPVQSWFGDISLLANYYESGEKKRAYHHTAPVNSLYAINEALRLVESETLATRWQRHADAAAELYARLESAGLELLVAPADRLASLTLVRIPDGVDDAHVRSQLLATRSIELGAGLGKFAGKAWRIGLMGDNATKARANFIADALIEASGC